jgi:hypothetical protein
MQAKWLKTSERICAPLNLQEHEVNAAKEDDIKLR